MDMISSPYHIRVHTNEYEYLFQPNDIRNENNCASKYELANSKVCHTVSNNIIHTYKYLSELLFCILFKLLATFSQLSYLVKCLNIQAHLDNFQSHNEIIKSDSMENALKIN